MIQSERPKIVLGRGPRACEQALFATINLHLQELGTQVLERPLHLLVPSHSLRSHLLERLVLERGRSVAGLSCWTLRGLAREILQRAGEDPPVGGSLLPILVRRAARQEKALRDRLDHLKDGYGALVGSVTDLLEAGLEPAHGEAISEVLETEGRQVATPAEVQRSQSLARVAIVVQNQMDPLSFGHVSSLLKRATEILHTEPDLLFPCSGFLVHGFADATGVATDLIESVLLRFGGSIFLDRPLDPIEPEIEDPACAFSRRFSERMFALGKIEPPTAGEPELPEPTLIAALGAQAEVREISWRIRRLLDNGARPERIAVISRQLGPYISSLRTHFGRLGIPYSAIGTRGPLLPMGRQIAALLEALTRREQTRLDRWLEARQSESRSVPVFDLRLALFGLGVSRLNELAALPLGGVLQQTTYPLPVRLGFATDEDRDTEVSLPRRRIPTDSLEQARDEAVQICDLFADWSRCNRWADHLGNLGRLLSLLRWSTDQDPGRQVNQLVDQLASGLPGDLAIELDEFVWLMTEALASVGRDRVGGHGGGVQILDVTEARGRTFDQLFLMGMNKGVFPRTVREDPALPDALRQVLGHEGHGVLPDLPRKRTGYAEERFLFAQLYSASPDLTISWQVADDDNKEITPSPLVERLLWSHPAIQVRSPQFLGPAATPGLTPRTSFEHAVRAALWGPPDRLVGPFAAAVPADQFHDATAIAEARLGIVAEVNRPAGDKSRLGPYFGFVGATREPIDPRVAQRLYITTLERFAECPWRTFLERILHVETLPDPVDVLPGLDPILVGRLVHRVLDRLVRERIPENPPSLEEARKSAATPIPWPGRAALQHRVQRESIAVAREQGIAWDGFASVLAQVVLPYLNQARDLVWDESGESSPVAAEMDGSLATGDPSSTRTLHFRADRVDVAATGLILTDYKTGRRGVSEAKTLKTREKHLLAKIRQGTLLQATAYAMAAGGSEDLGRYAYIRPDFAGPEETRITTVGARAKAAHEAFDTAVGALLEAWDAGVFFPRLIEPDADREPRACELCAVAEACLRGDSGARGRLRDWTAHQHQGDRTEKALLDAWQLASTKERQP